MSNTWEQRYLRGSYERLCSCISKLENIRCYDQKEEEDVYALQILINNARYYYAKSDIGSYRATLADYKIIARNSSNFLIEFTSIDIGLARS